MRGSPLLRAFIALLVLGSFGWPLHRLLSSVEKPALPAPAPALASETGKRAVHLQVSFTSPPTHFRLLALGEAVWEEAAPAPEIERDTTLVWPADGIELVLEAEWPPHAKAAARLRLSSSDGITAERLVWSAGKTSAVLAFP